MNAFLVNSREKIKVNRDGGDRQWPQWFLGVEKWDSNDEGGVGQGASVQELANNPLEKRWMRPWRGRCRDISLIPEVFFLRNY